MIFSIIFFALISVGFCAEPAVPGLFDCVYKCSGSLTKSPNPNNTPTTNGCGDYGFRAPNNLLPNSVMLTCCNDHDICYETCSKTKDACDTAFKDCMINSCNGSSTCKFVADSFYGTVRAFGCPSYLTKQKRACLCV